MVRYFEPARTDPSVLFLRGIQNLFRQKLATVKEEEAKKALNYFFAQTFYRPLFKRFIRAGKEIPDVILDTNCEGNNFSLSSRRNYSYFPAEYKPNEHKLLICLNYTPNLLELKQNVDRELIMAYDHQVAKKAVYESDEDYACSALRACSVQYLNYPKWSDELRKQASLSCAKYLMRVL
jgi:ferredoxin